MDQSSRLQGKIVIVEPQALRSFYTKDRWGLGGVQHPLGDSISVDEQPVGIHPSIPQSCPLVKLRVTMS